MYKLGIVGFGVVGKSVLAFLNKQNADWLAERGSPSDLSSDNQCMDVRVWDIRKLGSDEEEIIKRYNASIVDSAEVGLEDFIKANDYIVASPGVDLNNYKDFSNKFLCELDFFTSFFSKPIVAITGSLGKTTVTKLLGKLANSISMLPSNQAVRVMEQFGSAHYFFDKTSLRVAIGGNIGIGMLDLIQQQKEYDLAILELSSFQLELNKKFAPDVAIWVNLHPNHLNRHASLLEYFEAKFTIIKFQTEQQVALLSLDLFQSPVKDWINERLCRVRSKICVYTEKQITKDIIQSIECPQFYMMYVDGMWLTLATIHHGVIVQTEKIFNMQHALDITFEQNWIPVLGALHLLGLDLKNLQDFLSTTHTSLLEDHHHRLEHFATVRGVDFYDDSKSTVAQSTLAAFHRLAQQHRPIILVVGGLSKGIDRVALISSLQDSPFFKKMYCFGKDCDGFSNCTKLATLEETVDDIAQIMQPGDIVLLSPSGSSFDLFQNYEHRGRVFKELVRTLALD